jgi:Pyruvate/2-oxoacid:ferredoxin oxidoreductase delta subunit
MRRKIVRIDESRCNGCGLCVPNCVEGALQIVDGKARLVSEVYCDGLGACLGHCPQDAIAVEERDAEAFDEEAVKKLAGRKHEAPRVPQGHSCPGVAVRSFGCPGSAVGDLAHGKARHGSPSDSSAPDAASALTHWPVQLRLVPPFAPFLKGAHLLVSADCVPFAVADFHKQFLDGRVVLVGCPKFDDVAHYAEKLTAILAEADPASLTVVRMEVPCCGGIVAAAAQARDSARPGLPITVVTVGVAGGVTTDVLAANEARAGR